MPAHPHKAPVELAVFADAAPTAVFMLS